MIKMFKGQDLFDLSSKFFRAYIDALPTSNIFLLREGANPTKASASGKRNSCGCRAKSSQVLIPMTQRAAHAVQAKNVCGLVGQSGAASPVFRIPDRLMRC
jgi:hypothetical protein